MYGDVTTSREKAAGDLAYIFAFCGAQGEIFDRDDTTVVNNGLHYNLECSSEFLRLFQQEAPSTLGARARLSIACQSLWHILSLRQGPAKICLDVLELLCLAHADLVSHEDLNATRRGPPWRESYCAWRKKMKMTL